MQSQEIKKETPTQHYVSAKDESVDMFENKFLNAFSRVHWTTPLILYVPVITYFSYVAFTDPNTAIWMVFALFFAGVFFWTFFEYIAHRFIFHFHPKSKLGKRIHFLMHGVHHDYPNDHWRLVMPPPFSIPLAFLFYFLFTLSLGYSYGIPVYIGFVFGYVMYDMLHYATHHAHFIKFKWFKKLKKHHMDHHFKHPDEGFGVSNYFWDIVFGTSIKDKKK